MKSALLILVVVILVHFWAQLTGLYDHQIAEGTIWIDNILHVLVGFASGLLWLSFVSKKVGSYRHISRTTLGFVALVACLWEGIEFTFFLLFPEFAIGFKIYSPTIAEASVDVLSNLVGGLFVLFRRYF